MRGSPALYVSPWRPWRGGASLLDKQRAVFCLEPSGDSPDRKSVSDDVAMGCIPVFFSAISSGLAPWFWAAAGSPGGGYVLIEHEPFLVGNVTLESELGRMPCRDPRRPWVPVLNR